MIKHCSKCGKDKPLSDFHNCLGAPYDKAYWCKVCAALNGKMHHKRRMLEDPNYRLEKRKAYIKNRHGITLQEYEDRVAQQNYSCAICEVKLLTGGHKTHLDHCHKTGNLRAILCTNCNRGLGHFQDSRDLLQKATAYLDAHIGNVETEKEVCQQ